MNYKPHIRSILNTLSLIETLPGDLRKALAFLLEGDLALVDYPPGVPQGRMQAALELLRAVPIEVYEQDLRLASVRNELEILLTCGDDECLS